MPSARWTWHALGRNRLPSESEEEVEDTVLSLYGKEVKSQMLRYRQHVSFRYFKLSIKPKEESVCINTYQQSIFSARVGEALCKAEGKSEGGVFVQTSGRSNSSLELALTTGQWALPEGRSLDAPLRAASSFSHDGCLLLPVRDSAFPLQPPFTELLQ